MATTAMRVLTVNVGSSSIRLDAFALSNAGPRHLVTHHGEREDHAACSIVRRFLDGLADAEIGCVAHRVVHGGARLTHPCILDAAAEREIAALAPLAPLHNPAALTWIHACREALGDHVPQVAVFDTAFFADLPEVASAYALPRELVRKHGLRRFGFHGIAHEGMWRRWRALNPNAACAGRVVTLQIGAGCSIAAIREGAPLDTSMGFSPLEGLVMATRSGDVDPGLLMYLQRAEAMSPDALEALLNEESGLRGISGTTGDMRSLLQSGDPAARLAVQVYCHRARKYVAGYLAVLGGADAILFGGGVGTNAPRIRAQVLDDMGWAGVELDSERNRNVVPEQTAVHASSSKIQIHVLPADEAAILAEKAAALVGGGVMTER
jgi:acetate kinase